MKGSVVFERDRGRWCVHFWHDGKDHKITRYKGEFMYHRKIAVKCLSMIQGDYEKYMDGQAAFRMEKYTKGGWTDIIEYYEQWMAEVVEPKRKPATIKGYWSYFENWIKPFFKDNPLMLHEVQIDTLHKMMNTITLSGKGKYNVMNCFHAFMDYAWRSKRIPEPVPFPKKEDYNIKNPVIKWLPEARQMAIIEAIPEIHRPIFLWLKYHLRRPSEACALYKEDYDPFNRVFIIRRTVSARRVVDSTKTNVEHIIPCHPRFDEAAKNLLKQNSSTLYMFVNPRSRKPGKRYTNESLNTIWRAACKDRGESIDLYSGLKHSSCSQYINEKGLSIDELQMITDHARKESVRRYAAVEVSRKRELMERGLTVITRTRPKTNEG